MTETNKNGHQDNPALGWFEKYIYLWIILAGVGGLLVGKTFPHVATTIQRVSWRGVSLPLAAAMFLVMLPPMARVKLEEIKKAASNVRPTIVTLVANWVIAPPLMWLLARIFVPEPEYRAGLILLGLAPCTAMVLFWIYFARGNLVQGVVVTAINAITTLILYGPTGTFYLGVGGVPVPFLLILLSSILFVGLPLLAGQLARRWLSRTRGEEWFEERFLQIMGNVSAAALLATILIMFSLQGQVILDNPLLALRLMVPNLIHYTTMITLTFTVCRLLRFTYEDTAMTTMISSSSQFEVAIGAAMVLFGIGSGAALATVVGPLLEIPLMVSAAKLLQRTAPRFGKAGASQSAPPKLDA
ncbi:MAG TPA: ACR3 family arsenite efflux transporter [Anaerolineae bacterium]|nr:ACR3 family arsenite efflux transporter [Anaerolineae bacterium]